MVHQDWSFLQFVNVRKQVLIEKKDMKHYYSFTNYQDDYLHSCCFYQYGSADLFFGFINDIWNFEKCRCHYLTRYFDLYLHSCFFFIFIVFKACRRGLKTLTVSPAEWLDLHPTEMDVLGMTTKLRLMLRLQFWRSGKCGKLHCHYSQLHSDSK